MTEVVLDAEGVFRVLCEESYQDGRLDDDEALLLTDVRALLRLGPERATEILERARARPGGKGRSFDRMEAFKMACRVAWADGRLEDAERRLAMGLADYLQIERNAAASLLQEAGVP